MTEPRAVAGVLLSAWQQRLRLSDWTIRISGAEPDQDDKSSVDIDVTTRIAALRFRADTPMTALERQLVHELLHVRLSEFEDLLNQAEAHTPPAFDKLADRWRARALESAIEALADALTGTSRGEWCSGGVWDEAFRPPDPEDR